MVMGIHLSSLMRVDVKLSKGRGKMVLSESHLCAVLFD